MIGNKGMPLNTNTKLTVTLLKLLLETKPILVLKLMNLVRPHDLFLIKYCLQKELLKFQKFMSLLNQLSAQALKQALLKKQTFTL